MRLRHSGPLSAAMAKARVLYMQPNDSAGLLDLHFTATGETKQRVLERNPRVTGGDTATNPLRRTERLANDSSLEAADSQVFLTDQ